MIYQEFKDYLVKFLWKAGDTQLISSLDNLISMAESGLNNQLRVERRHSSAIITADAEEKALPDDYFSIRQVADISTQLGEFVYVSPAEIRSWRLQTNSSQWRPIYSIEDTNLLLCGPAANPIDLVVDYTNRIPDFKTTDSSWLADDYLDLYTYAVLSHSAPFLREDERIVTWKQGYAEALQSINEASAFEQQRGVYDAKRLPRVAAGTKASTNRSRRGYKLYGRP